MIKLPAIGTALLAAAAIAAAGTPASALSLKDCSAKYNAAKTNGTLAGRSWNDYQRIECAYNSKPLASTKTAAPATTKKVSATPAKPVQKPKHSALTQPVVPAAKKQAHT